MNGFPATMQLSVGLDVIVEGRRGRVVEMVSLETVKVMDQDSGKISSVKVDDIRPAVDSPHSAPVLDALSDEDLAKAKERFQAIEPLIDVSGRSRAMVEKRAKDVGFSASAIYKWLRMYESAQTLSSLAPGSRADKGSSRLSEAVESIIQSVIESEYLTRQKKTASWIVREVKRRCLAAGVEPPHGNTVRYRLKRIPLYKQVSKRQGRKEAQDNYTPIKGEFPGADWPLAVLQIDHTQLDIILVDDVNREPVGRPWITMGIDVFSRMVTGFCISFDPPGALSTGLCLAHSMLPKESWLAERSIEGDWPFWGKPVCVHADNAKEFRGSMLERACAQYRINTEWRPVAQPRYGGHIERLLGTFAQEIHALPGTTFSNTQERGRYDSEGRAVFTLRELETWLGTLIVQVYHCSPHSALKMPPIEKYKQGLLGTKEKPGVGLPPRIMDESRLRLDFMPFLNRTVQDYGIVIDGIHYWHDVLRPWINAVDPQNAKAKRKFTVRRDPRDISRIWFFDPELNEYYEVPYRDTSHPPISVWELREAQRRLKEDGRKNVNEHEIFEALTRLREMEEQAKKETKAVRRARQRRNLGIGAAKKAVAQKEAVDSPVIQNDLEELDDLEPFDEMEELS
jgi:putative transposase